MRKSEKNSILATVALWSDSHLEEEYYKSVLDCLGSQADEMEERGYDPVDVCERRKIESYNCEYSHLLESVCQARGISLWDREHPEKCPGGDAYYVYHT